MEELRLVKKIPISLRNNFWTAVIDSIDLEIQNMKAQIETKKTLYDINTMDYDRLIEISELLGVLFDASINDSVDFLRREVKAIPFKIKYKSTAKLYLSFFRALSRIGDMYIYYFKSSSDALVRNSRDLLLDATSHTFPDPYFQYSSQDFSGFLDDALKLDQGQVLDVENEGIIWTLDTVDSLISTNHIGLEFFIDRIISKQVRNDKGVLVDKDFLITWEYMDFIMVNTNFSRRVKEVPHVGAQLTAIADESKTVNPLDDNYSIPDLELKCLITDNYAGLESVLDLSYIEFGIGSHTNLPTKEGISGEEQPTDLDLRVARNYILFDEKYENDDFLAVTSEYRGQQINRFTLHDETGYKLDNIYGIGQVDGYTNYFEGQLLFAPLQKGNIRFVFTHLGIVREIFDDKRGYLIGDEASGTIDYNTGEYTLNMDFNYKAEDTILVGDGIISEIEYEVTLPYPIQTTVSLNPSDTHVLLRYIINNKTFLAIDNGSGTFIDLAADGHLTSGTVDYNNGVFHFLFDSPITDDSEVILTYQYRKVATPDANTDINADYYFTVQTIEITEAGLFDLNNNLIAYTTFPPVEFNSNKNHLNLNFLIKKGTF